MNTLFDTPLFKQMNMLRKMQNRLASNKHTQQDINYLAQCLNDLCAGHPPEEVFKLTTSGKGIKRSDFNTLITIARAFHYMKGALEHDLIALTDESGNIIDLAIPKDRAPLLKTVLRTAGPIFGIDPKTLERYWYDPDYKQLKVTVCDDTIY